MENIAKDRKFYTKLHWRNIFVQFFSQNNIHHNAKKFQEKKSAGE
jgi:hypothetical protein